jgi:hypothetical protein
MRSEKLNSGVIKLYRRKKKGLVLLSLILTVGDLLLP